jgi:hypothetical protein
MKNAKDPSPGDVYELDGTKTPTWTVLEYNPYTESVTMCNSSDYEKISKKPSLARKLGYIQLNILSIQKGARKLNGKLLFFYEFHVCLQTS